MSRPIVLTLSHLSYTYPDAPTPLFEDVSATFPIGWSAIIGDNGIGKTTLMRLAIGTLRPDSGTISPAPESLVVAYCPQHIDLPPANLEDFASDWSPEALAVRSALGIDDDWCWRWGSLSGGEAKRLQLACAFTARPDVLVLDEPTNHVDEPTRTAIINAMQSFKGVGLLVSHDVELIDTIAIQCVSFERRHTAGRNITVLKSWPSGWSAAAEQRERQNEYDAKRLQTAKQEMQRLASVKANRFADVQKTLAMRSNGRKIDPKDHDARAAQKGLHDGHVDRAAVKRYRQLDGRLADVRQKAERLTVAAKRYNGDIWLDVSPSHRNELVRLHSGIIRYGSTDVIEVIGGRGDYVQSDTDHFVDAGCAVDPARCARLLTDPDGRWQIEPPESGLSSGLEGLYIPTLSVGPRDHIALIGPNGLGKTTLVDAMLDEIPSDIPVLMIAQNTTADDAKAALARLSKLQTVDQSRVLAAYAQLNADPDRLLFGEAPSPGELRKLLLCLGLAAKPSPQFIIMDEPTNHLDLESKQSLARVLKDCPIAWLIVTHDHWFLDKCL
ncbi:ATP-binding cassette domain-containing protein [Bifidobacterium oedipodis]|uniref:ABC transporter n=1 Tax=Bifidobacterium oedipodis TaxID=2675322 RepID=A0A7Y0ENP3_9BIFI|nr:ATP-binding cassette domain-containing protein [Bifidobacterium sp. DSM 109957]NMM93609.1 ABC transporter [Bifidobacterium sp. DSM 109957]